MNIRFLISRVSAICLLVGLLVAVASYWRLRIHQTAGSSGLAPARLAARGERVPRLVQCREEPIRVFPSRQYSDIVEEDDLVAVLCGALPIWEPLIVPTAYHELRLWGREFRFTKEMLGAEVTGDFLVQTVLNDSACRANTTSEGGDYLLDSPFGIRVVRSGTEDIIEFRGEGHLGQLLMVLGVVGVPSKTQASTSAGHTGTVADIYQDAVFRFSTSDELEFIGCALALWHPPQKTWTDQYNVEHSFDELLDKLITIPHGRGSCGGCHVPYSVNLILRVDEQYRILSPEVRRRGKEWLDHLSRRLEMLEISGGGWDKSWGLEQQIGRIYGDEVLDKITVTGHHLEWIALASTDVIIPAKEVLRRAVLALRRDVEALPLLSHRSFKSLLPVSHGALALALMRRADPFGSWVRSWKEGKVVCDDWGYHLKAHAR